MEIANRAFSARLSIVSVATRMAASAPYMARNAKSAQDDLIKAMTNASDLELKTLRPYTIPYLAWLQTQYESADVEFMSIIVDPEKSSDSDPHSTTRHGARNTDATPRRPSFPLFCRVLVVVAQAVSSDPALSIEKLCTRLQGSGYLTAAEVSTFPAYQLAFSLLGWISMLYLPPTRFDHGKLHLANTSQNKVGMLRPRTWISYAQDASEEFVMNKFCNTLVRFSGYSKGPFPSPLHPADDSRPLLSTNLSYYTLAGLGELKIQWVDSLLEHLELDENLKILKLFRCPSYCMLMCQSSHDRCTFLEHLFAQQDRVGNYHTGEPQDLRSGNFFQEVLYTFCLIFGQQEASYKKFKQDLKTGKAGFSEAEIADVDPMLKELCTTPWIKGSTKELLDFNGVKLSYSPRNDFPFFAKRLLILQEYTSNIIPNDWRSLWIDRRDLNRFYTIWPALIFGIAALSIGLLQVVLAIVQILEQNK